MAKIWKVSKVKTQKNLAFESKDIFINDFSIQKQRLMSSFLKNETCTFSNATNTNPSSGNLFKVGRKDSNQKKC